MTTTPVENGRNVSPRGNEKPRDKYIDTQYVKPSSTADQYAEKPWEHCQDYLASYLSLREQSKSAFRHEIDETQQYRITRENHRIDWTRKRFSSYDNKKSLIQTLEDSKREWREEVTRVSALNLDTRVNTKSPKHAGLIQRSKSRKPDTSVPIEGPTPPDSIRVGSVLQTKEPIEDPPGQSLHAATVQDDSLSKSAEESVKSEPMYGIRASAMYFKRAKDVWVGTDYPQSPHSEYSGHFPNQKIPVDKILDKQKNNPLMEDCPKDHIRYFHFPTNNMSWIEVRNKQVEGGVHGRAS